MNIVDFFVVFFLFQVNRTMANQRSVPPKRYHRDEIMIFRERQIIVAFG